MKDISKKTFCWTLISLIAVRILMVFLLMQDIPRTGVQEGGWWFYHGGDEEHYFNLAKSISQLKPVKEKVTLGYPLFLAPFVYITQAENIKDILKPVFISQAFLLFSLSIILISLIAEKIFQSRIIGAISGGVFTFLPYLVLFLLYGLAFIYPSFGAFSLIQGPIEFSNLSWLMLYSDPLSTFSVYLCFFLFFIEINKESPRFSRVFLMGILSGLSALVKLGNILIIGIFILGWLLRKRVKEACLTGIFAFLIFLPQLFYNQEFFGSPFTFGYQSYDDYPSIFSLFSFNRLFGIFEKVYLKVPILIWILPFLIIFLLLGARSLMRKNRLVTIVLILWLLSYLLFYSSYVPAGGYVAFRFYMPITPPFTLLSIASVIMIFQWLKRKSIFGNKKNRLNVIE